jgi:hypothetical protein
VSCSFCFQNVFSLIGSPYLHQLRRETASSFQCEIINVHAGAENRTAIHLQPFRALCQPQFFGFHRFFPVFSGFVRIWAPFYLKNPSKMKKFYSSPPSSHAHFAAALRMKYFPEHP